MTDKVLADNQLQVPLQRPSGGPVGEAIATIDAGPENPLEGDVDAWIEAVRRAGVVFRMSTPNKMTAQPWSLLTEGDKAFLRANRAAAKNRVRAGLPELMPLQTDVAPQHRSTVQPIVEREPELYAYGRRVTESDVLEALRNLGDEALADYASGRMPKAKAYEIAHRRECQLRELLSTGRRRYER